MGLTVNNEYIACGSETNEVFVYHKVGKHLKQMVKYFGIRSLNNLFYLYIYRQSPNLQLHIDLVLMRIMLTMIWDHISSVLCAGRVIAQQC